MTIQVSQNTYDYLVTLRDDNLNAINVFNDQITAAQVQLADVTERAANYIAILADLEVE